MRNLIASAATKEELEQAINHYYFSGGLYIITEDNHVYNSKRGECLTGVKVEVKKGRWRFVLA